VTPAEAAALREAKRDPRLDFFRGLGMFIILIAHIPWNSWNNWIPARFGYSDATEIFVFCSGAASAIAFYKVFEARGWWIGTARVAFRIWQLYWCHIAVFFTVLVTLMLVMRWVPDPERDYVTVLNLRRFVNDPEAFLPPLFWLGYVPNYFDILVMYMVILALMPVVVWLAGFRKPGARPWLAMGFCVALWALAGQPWLAFLDVPVFTGLNLPAEPVGNDRTWFFNPFCWQLIFFTGFAFSLGWLPTPPVRWWLILICLAVVLVSIPLDPDGVPARRFFAARPELGPLWEKIRAFQASVGPLQSKTFFGLFRYLHFLALAYLVWVAAGENGKRLPRTGLLGGLVTVIRRVGQQALAVFIFSLVIARLLGVVIHEFDKELWVVALVNLSGFAMLIGVAYTARWFKSNPWRVAPKAA
jgi:hypothetical protein